MCKRCGLSVSGHFACVTSPIVTPMVDTSRVERSMHTPEYCLDQARGDDFFLKRSEPHTHDINPETSQHHPPQQHLPETRVKLRSSLTSVSGHVACAISPLVTPMIETSRVETSMHTPVYCSDQARGDSFLLKRSEPHTHDINPEPSPHHSP